MIRGGIPDKLGNRYEAKWLVRQLLDVIAGKAEWLRFEGITPQFTGFEFAIGKGGITEWHQTKMNAPKGNWTIRALERENVLAAFRNRLEASTDVRCRFVSQDPAKDLRTLVEKAGIANDLLEFKEAVTDSQKDKFDQLIAAWEVDDTTGYAWLRWCEFLTFPETELEAIITSHSDLYFASGGPSAFPVLREYLEARFNKILSTESVRAEFRDEAKLVIKDWSLDPTLREKLRLETDAYLQTYSPFGAGGASPIPRPQIFKVAEHLKRPAGPRVVLLTGIAGSGKSGVVRGLIGKLLELDIAHLAFRVDHHLNRGTPQEIGQALTGRMESPVSTLKGLEPERLSVLIIDQVDAVSEVSGRSGIVKDAVLRMVNDAKTFETVRLVLVCRSFDLDSDPRLKALKEAKRVEQIDVPLLAWEDEVALFLRDKGIDTDALSRSQKDLLCLPLNLAIFLEVITEGQAFASRNDLLEMLMQRKGRAIRKYPNVAWPIVSPLTALARWMSDRQTLDAPDTVLDDFPHALDLLSTEGLIVATRKCVNFFHECFFDYLYSRSFVHSDQSLVDLLTSTEQHLFRRTQSRQILEALRDNDQRRYLRELEDVLGSNSIRYHIKVAVAQWLGSLSDPMEKERDIVLRLNDNNEHFPPLVRYALLSSAGWFRLLHKNGWIEAALNGDSDVRRQDVLWWLSKIAREHPSKVAALLDAWWGDDPERGKSILDWFGFVRRQKPDKAFLALCEKVIRSNPQGLFGDNAQDRKEMLLATWAEKNADEGSGVLRALFDAWFVAHPNRHPFERDALHHLDTHSLGKIAQKSPKAFLSGTIEAFSRSIDIANRRQVEGGHDYSFMHRSFSGSRLGEDEFLDFFRSALRKTASEDPTLAREFLSRLDVSKHEALTHLHLETVSANGEAFASHLLDLLGNKDLLDAGWSGAAWESFADAARGAFPYLSTDDRRRVEEVIFAHQPEIELAIKVAHEIKEHGETEQWQNRQSVVWYLNRSGFEQWCILESIGEDLLTHAGVRHLKRLRRKFPGEKVQKSYHVEGDSDGPPISRDKIALVTDANWLRAIAHYDENDRRHDRDFGSRRTGKLAVELQQATKENPARFVALMKRIPHHAHPTHVSHILWGLSELKELDEDLLKEAVIDAHARPDRPYGEDIARLFEKHPEIAKDPFTFDVLGWYVENGQAKKYEATEASNAEGEIVSINDLVSRGGRPYIHGMNSPRGRAAEAMGTVLWTAPEMAGKAWGILDRRIEREQLGGVRCCLMRAFVPLFNDDRLRCAQLVERLVDGPSKILGKRGQKNPHLFLTPLITHQGVRLLPYVLHWVPDVGRRLLDRLFNSGDERMVMIGAWHVFGRSFQDETYASEADRLIEEGEVYRRLAADVASHAIVREEFRERAELQLIRFFDDEDKHVRQQAGDVFREIEPDEFFRFSGLAEAFLASRSLQLDSSSPFFGALEKATSSVHELVIRAAEKLVAYLETEGTEVSRRTLDLHQLQDLLKREYAATENDPEFRRRLLDLIDTMVERELYGTDRILKAHERE